MAVLTNQESGEAFESIAYRIADHYLGAPATDWLAAFTKLDDAPAGLVPGGGAEGGPGAQPDVDARRCRCAQYAGTYRDAWYGDIAIEAQGDKLVMRFTQTPSLVGDLEHWQYDTFVVRWRDRELRADAFVTFALNPDGAIDQAKMRAVSPATDFSFDFQDLLLKPVK